MRKIALEALRRTIHIALRCRFKKGGFTIKYPDGRFRHYGALVAPARAVQFDSWEDLLDLYFCRVDKLADAFAAGRIHDDAGGLDLEGLMVGLICDHPSLPSAFGWESWLHVSQTLVAGRYQERTEEEVGRLQAYQLQNELAWHMENQRLIIALESTDFWLRRLFWLKLSERALWYASIVPADLLPSEPTHDEVAFQGQSLMNDHVSGA